MLACAESNFSNFKFEYLRENDFLIKTLFACLSGAQMSFINEKKIEFENQRGSVTRFSNSIANFGFADNFRIYFENLTYGP